MVMPEAPRTWTLEAMHALPDDGNRYELIDGELFVTPAPSGLHQRTLQYLAQILMPHGERIEVEVLQAPFGVRLPGPGEVQPDLVAFERKRRQPLPATIDITTLLLAVEVQSPTTARADRFRKRQLYQSAGVPEYWIVDTTNRWIERWRAKVAEPSMIADAMTWRPRGEQAGLEVNVRLLFQRIFQETPAS